VLADMLCQFRVRACALPQSDRLLGTRSIRSAHPSSHPRKRRLAPQTVARFKGLVAIILLQQAFASTQTIVPLDGGGQCVRSNR
jgi:hypothetical protein